MDRKPVFLQGMWCWFPMEKLNGLTLEEQQDQSPEILADEVIYQINIDKGSLDRTGIVKFLSKQEAYSALTEAANTIRGNI